MKKITLLLALGFVFIFGTGCGVLKIIPIRAVNKVAWAAIGKDGDKIAQELGRAQVDYIAAQKKAGEALGVKDEVYAALSDADQLTKDVKGFDKDSASKLKTASAGSAKANEAIERALAENPKLDAKGKKLMAEANIMLGSASVKMIENTAETVAVCIGIKKLVTSDKSAHKAIAVILIIPATTMASYVMKDMKASSKTVKAIRKYSVDQGVEVPGDEVDFGGLDDIETEGLPTEADAEEAEEK